MCIGLFLYCRISGFMCNIINVYSSHFWSNSLYKKFTFTVYPIRSNYEKFWSSLSGHVYSSDSVIFFRSNELASIKCHDQSGDRVSKKNKRYHICRYLNFWSPTIYEWSLKYSFYPTSWQEISFPLPSKCGKLPFPFVGETGSGFWWKKIWARPLWRKWSGEIWCHSHHQELSGLKIEMEQVKTRA